MVDSFHGRRVVAAAAQEVHKLVAGHTHGANKVDDFKVFLLGALGFQLFELVLELGNFAAGLFDLAVNSVNFAPCNKVKLSFRSAAFHSGILAAPDRGEQRDGVCLSILCRQQVRHFPIQRRVGLRRFRYQECM